MRFSYRSISIALLFLGAGILVGYIAGFYHEKNLVANRFNTIHPLRENSVSYKFIRPLLAYIIPDADQEKEFLDLKKTISHFIEQEKHQQSLDVASVFISDLDRGRWIGIDEDEAYEPASMLKVVIMVAYFKEEEQDVDILEKRLTYSQVLSDLLKKDTFNSTSMLEVGKAYQIEELINKMIIDSDNGAELLLLNNVNQSILQDIYKNLDIKTPESFVGNFTISPRQYSLFFRVLYSATYLHKSMSEKALEVLSKTTFTEGIIAGLPKGIPVSHKFGERVKGSSGQIESVELHDCGIVYYEENPYLLCIMTKGSNEKDLQEVISGISRLVYQHHENVTQ